MATIGPTFSAGGLISGLDTASIVDQLVALESRPITQLKTLQAAYQTQITKLGDIVSRLADLRTAAQDLGTNGALAAKVTSSNSAFGATVGAGALSGRYSVRVDQVAQASKWMSAGFASSASTVANGALSLSIGGTSYGPITTDGLSLSDLAYAIRQTNAPVSATVLNGWDPVGNKAVSYLSITARDTGFTPGGSDSLAITFTPGSGGTGQDPAFTEKQAARNAAFNIDGVDYVRQTNTVTDAITGVTLNLTRGATAPATQGTAEDLTLETDVTATQARLQKFADAYNGVMSLVQGALAVTKDTDRKSTLAGDSAVRGLQGLLQSIVVNQVSGLPGIRTLADVGLKTNRDGRLTVDTTTLSSALARDPSAVDALFSTSTTGISAFVTSLVDRETRSGTGVLTSDQASLTARITAMDSQMAAMQLRVDAYKTNLVRQFTAMETTLSSLKSTGNYLNAQLSKSTGG
jgi:flagellar hook-associated protein 2